jgi:hypothetical protein
MYKIVQIMSKFNEFSNKMTKFSSSSDYDKEKTKRKDAPKKQKTKKRQKKKLQRKPATKPEIFGGFDYKRIGDRMLQKNDRSTEGYGG